MCVNLRFMPTVGSDIPSVHHRYGKRIRHQVYIRLDEKYIHREEKENIHPGGRLEDVWIAMTLTSQMQMNDIPSGEGSQLNETSCDKASQESGESDERSKFEVHLDLWV